MRAPPILSEEGRLLIGGAVFDGVWRPSFLDSTWSGARFVPIDGTEGLLIRSDPARAETEIARIRPDGFRWRIRFPWASWPMEMRASVSGDGWVVLETLRLSPEGEWELFVSPDPEAPLGPGGRPAPPPPGDVRLLYQGEGERLLRQPASSSPARLVWQREGEPGRVVLDLGTLDRLTIAADGRWIVMGPAHIRVGREAPWGEIALPEEIVQGQGFGLFRGMAPLHDGWVLRWGNTLWRIRAGMGGLALEELPPFGEAWADMGAWRVFRAPLVWLPRSGGEPERGPGTFVRVRFHPAPGAWGVVEAWTWGEAKGGLPDSPCQVWLVRGDIRELLRASPVAGGIAVAPWGIVVAERHGIRILSAAGEEVNHIPGEFQEPRAVVVDGCALVDEQRGMWVLHRPDRGTFLPGFGRLDRGAVPAPGFPDIKRISAEPGNLLVIRGVLALPV